MFADRKSDFPLSIKVKVSQGEEEFRFSSRFIELMHQRVRWHILIHNLIKNKVDLFVSESGLSAHGDQRVTGSWLFTEQADWTLSAL